MYVNENETSNESRQLISCVVLPLTQGTHRQEVSVYSSELRIILLSRHHQWIEEASALDRENHVHTPTGEFGTPGLARHVGVEKTRTLRDRPNVGEGAPGA